MVGSWNCTKKPAMSPTRPSVKPCSVLCAAGYTEGTLGNGFYSILILQFTESPLNWK